jgi:hypothetical protein
MIWTNGYFLYLFQCSIGSFIFHRFAPRSCSFPYLLIPWFRVNLPLIVLHLVFFLCFLISRTNKMQAVKLKRQVTNPIISAYETPNYYFTIYVTKTLAISPISGKIKVNPANFPIQLDDIFACIMYNTSAVVPSITRPTIMKG